MSSMRCCRVGRVSGAGKSGGMVCSWCFKSDFSFFWKDTVHMNTARPPASHVTRDACTRGWAHLAWHGQSEWRRTCRRGCGPRGRRCSGPGWPAGSSSAARAQQRPVPPSSLPHAALVPPAARLCMMYVRRVAVNNAGAPYTPRAPLGCHRNSLGARKMLSSISAQQRLI